MLFIYFFFLFCFESWSHGLLPALSVSVLPPEAAQTFSQSLSFSRFRFVQTQLTSGWTLITQRWPKVSLERWSSTLPPPQINAPARAQPEVELLFLHLLVGLSFFEQLTGKSDSKTPTDVNLHNP